MSGIMMMVMGSIGKSNGIVSSFTHWEVVGEGYQGLDNADCMLFVGSNGTVSGVGAIVDNTTPGSPNWYFPTTAGIGNSYWVRFTLEAGTYTYGTVNTWLALTTDRYVELLRYESDGFGGISGSFKIEIATDSSGTSIVFTSTGNTLVAVIV